MTGNNGEQAEKKVHARPTKGFFVRMLTKDISLEDCIMDLLDNSIDGARRTMAERGDDLAGEVSYEGFRVEIRLDADSFEISDNCGGITLDNAIDYAFSFGRRPDAPKDADYSIGMYGIGMKRALFKIGRQSIVTSTTHDASFRVNIDVDRWEGDPDNWDFDYEDAAPLGDPGVSIETTRLNRGIGEEFSDPVFLNGVVDMIARDYSFVLHRGLGVSVNGSAVTGIDFALRTGDEILPARLSFEEGGVRVELFAGLAGDPPQDSSAESEEIKRADVDRYGWFVACNDRVVLAADKGRRTVWGDDGFPIWHAQYNGFMGFVNFRSSEAAALPWTTTKRDIDGSDPLWRRAVAEMKVLTRPFIDYTAERKTDLAAAKQSETGAATPLREIVDRPRLRLPEVKGPPVTRISYTRAVEDVLAVKRVLDNERMTNKEVGIRTFEYFRSTEVGE